MDRTLTIHIDRLRLYAYHGVMAQERVVGNDFEVSLSLRCANPLAGSDDRLESTINYAEVIEVVKAEMAKPSDLLENVAFRIMTSLGNRFPAVAGGCVTVRKLMPPCGVDVESVGVSLEW